MLSRHSPLKRKHNEYHDPDYPRQENTQTNVDNEKPGCSKNFQAKRKKSGEGFETKNEMQSEIYYDKVRQIIEREFKKEIVIKQQQLDEIDERLQKAKNLLERLRYGIVSAYYKKQEIPLTTADAVALRGPNCLFEREDKGPQMPLHPSIKKLIGKRPKDLSEVIRSCPKRTAAQNAVQTIRAKSSVQKREERKLKQIIRDQGIVIDHSKQNATSSDVKTLLNAAAQNTMINSKILTSKKIKQEESSNALPNTISGKALNASRLNNKIKYLIVVGNTSKYIGNEIEKDVRPQIQNLTYKWLVYVQSKENKRPIECFVKKVRFYLHHSYRPNDIVDVESPPFQVSRRGWGEFPIRVQLFFHQEYHQKPIQLMHNIILDQTLSGIQTLGAETLLEIWLRDVKSMNSPTIKEEKVENIEKKPEIPSKLKNNISRNDDFVDDNLLEFLNKIDATPCSISADIEKIQPTVLVTEPLPVKLKTPSPEKRNINTTIHTPCSISADIEKIQPTVLVTEPLPVKLETPSPEKRNISATIHTPCSISADIEKIQPTVLVTEHLPVKLKTPSPEKKNINVTIHTNSPVKINTTSEVVTISEKSSPLLSTALSDNKTSVSVSTTTSSTTTITFKKAPIFTNGTSTSKPMTTFVRLPTSSAQVKFINSLTTTTTTTTNSYSNIPPLRPITHTPTSFAINVSTSNLIQPNPSSIGKSSIVSKDGKILMPSSSVASAVHRTILPIVNNIPTTIATATHQIQQLNKTVSLNNKPQVFSVSSATTLTSTLSNTILQKKLVQLVDSTGKVKYIQMLVAANSQSNPQNTTTASVTPKLITIAPSSVKSSTVTNTTQVINTTTTPLISSNGVNLTSAMTMKPNIFKIVPESMQTKPQVITFSTTAIATPNANTVTNANNLQQLQTITNTTQTTCPLTASSATIITKSKNLTLPAANKLQKPNGSAPTKNLVFQKEGKLYIIDPEQMKYRQQQKKQVSLLKPQISLLRQQQPQKQCTLQKPSASINSLPVMNPTAQCKSIVAQTHNIYAPSVHYGLKQQRINSMNALQLLQMKKVLFEKQFLRQEFTSMRSAVEFLLRRLKLIVPKDSLVSAFPFVCHSLQEFYSLTAFKQRACEWLRSKNISRMIRNHKDLQRINQNSIELFWSTKEIATFARHYAYTPPIKSLPKPGEGKLQNEDGTNNFKDLVKSELQQKQKLHYDTLTDQRKVKNWVDKIWHTLKDYEHYEDEFQIIDVDSISKEEETNIKCKEEIVNTSKHYHLPSLDVHLPPPAQLEHSSQIVSDICKDLGVKLTYEELDSRVYHQSTKTVLAECLQLFIEKILRQTIALKQEIHSTLATDTIFTILPEDLAKVLATNSEFDFLTNNHFGSTTLAECLVSSIKHEKP